MKLKIKAMKKYVCCWNGKVISRIAEKTVVYGYTIGVLEPFFPSDEELLEMSRKEVKEWIKTNNRRMKAICKFLNENQL